MLVCDGDLNYGRKTGARMSKLFLIGGAAALLSACATPAEPVQETPEPAKQSESRSKHVSKPAPTPIPTVSRPKISSQIITDVKTPIEKIESVYGHEMPLVCTQPVLAQGPLANRPNMQTMWENYLYDRPEGIWGEIGGLVEVNGNLPPDQGQWTNACTVRFSHMLNKAGHKITRIEGQTVSGANKDQYFYRLADFEAYLTAIYGAPDIAVVDGSGNQFDLPITPGIVLMDFPNSGFTGHVTIWNGAGTVDGVNIGGYRVLFWHLPCFIPEDRKIAAASEVEANDLTLP